MGGARNERVADYRALGIAGLIACAALGSFTGYRIVHGLVTGAVVCVRRCRFRLVYHASEQPLGYWSSMFGWGLWLAFSLISLAFIAYWVTKVGGLFGSREERLTRRITQLRRGIDNAIFMNLIAMIPRSWRAARLNVEHVSGPGDRLIHAIVSPEGDPKVIPLTGELRRATSDLLALFEVHGVRFHTVTYCITLNENGTWRCRIETDGPQSRLPD